MYMIILREKCGRRGIEIGVSLITMKGVDRFCKWNSNTSKKCVSFKNVQKKYDYKVLITNLDDTYMACNFIYKSIFYTKPTHAFTTVMNINSSLEISVIQNLI